MKRRTETFDVYFLHLEVLETHLALFFFFHQLITMILLKNEMLKYNNSQKWNECVTCHLFEY